MEKRYVACFDIGGTSIKTALCDTTGVIYHKQQYAIKETFEELSSIFIHHVRMLQETYTLQGVAISSCGAVDTKSGIIGGCSAVPCIHGPNWKQMIEESLHLPCAIENDANCAALSELYFGEAKDVQNMAFIVCGTGIGGAIVKNRKIHHGANLYGGEFGMMLLQCDGKFTNYSTLASTVSMVRKMEKIEPTIVWDGRKIFEEAKDGNVQCQKVIDEFYYHLAIGIFNIQHIYDPELILLGGAISCRETFVEEVYQGYEKIKEVCDLAYITPKIKCCTFQQDANLLGALANFLQQENGK